MPLDWAQKKYLTHSFLRNRNRSFPFESGKYKFLDTTGAYPGFKEKKSSEVFMCSCCKEPLSRDIDKLNIMLEKDRQYKASKGDQAYKYGGNLDIVGSFAGLIPKAVFKAIDFEILRKFRLNGHIEKKFLFENIKFDYRICRLCKVEDGESKSLSLDEFNEFKSIYAHQVMNELNAYSTFSACRKLSYCVQEYELTERGEVYSKKKHLDIDEIKKVIPLDEEEWGYSRFWIGKTNVKNPESNFEDINLLMKRRLNYGKALGKWKREEELYHLIRKTYKKYNVIYQYRPQFLYNSYSKGQQSIDIFIEDLNIGIEYQGKQHYQAVEMFGGTKGLLETQRRDKEKLDKCTSNGIKIVYVKYDEKIDSKMIKEKINEAIKNSIIIQNVCVR
ncbi:hypothetical protein [Clostridium sp. HCS.1]|uniref:hypothetical protein n=1 Tax=Clostridium sp. HCS.1 TaxID=3238594 RepID=UPI003A0FCBC4